MSSVSCFIGGLLVGVGVGTAAGMLLAPRSGYKTRRYLRHQAEALTERVEQLPEQMEDQVASLAARARKSVRASAAQANVAIDKTASALTDAIR